MIIKSLFEHNLCTRCTGRIFANVDTGMTNLERGKSLLFAHKSLYGDVKEVNKCWLCNNIFDQFDKYYNMVNDLIGEYEYESFLIGSKFDKSLLLEEESLQNDYGSKGESIKKEFNREFGKYFSMKSGKEYSKYPDMTIHINTIYDNVEVIIKSLYVYGKYIKKRRDIPQTRWVHGSGDSIESIIGDQLMKMALSENYHLHGAGREDVDVMMLGNGREFVIEAVNPKIRKIDMDKFQENVNSSGKNVFISDLSFCTKDTVKEIKESKYDKVYLAEIESGNNIDEQRFREATRKLVGIEINQRTPIRVIGNRSDIIRKKEIKYINIDSIGYNTAIIKVCAESGTYIKELVNGDGGRTLPSLSSMYGDNLYIKSLDVININRGD